MWGAEWTWDPGFSGLIFEQWQNHVFIVQHGIYIDQFKCRARTAPGRFRACRRWLEATQWVQPPLSDDLEGFVTSSKLHE